MTACRTLGRGLLVPPAAAVTVAGCWWLTAPPLRAAGSAAGSARGSAAAIDVEDALAAGCAAVLLGCSLWVATTAVLCALTETLRALAPGRRATHACATLSRALTPAMVRRLVAAAVGAGIGLGLAPASAAEPPTPTLTGLPLPERVTGGLVASAARATLGPAAAGGRHVVGPGESLWTIAAARLPDAATDADITAAWRRLHRANLERVADPDLIHPGTRLVVPDLDRKELP